MATSFPQTCVHNNPACHRHSAALATAHSDTFHSQDKPPFFPLHISLYMLAPCNYQGIIIQPALGP